jgi:hypothetical protein
MVTTTFPYALAAIDIDDRRGSPARRCSHSATAITTSPSSPGPASGWRCRMAAPRPGRRRGWSGPRATPNRPWPGRSTSSRPGLRTRGRFLRPLLLRSPHPARPGLFQSTRCTGSPAQVHRPAPLRGVGPSSSQRLISPGRRVIPNARGAAGLYDLRYDRRSDLAGSRDHVHPVSGDGSASILSVLRAHGGMRLMCCSTNDDLSGSIPDDLRRNRPRHLRAPH